MPCTSIASPALVLAKFNPSILLKKSKINLSDSFSFREMETDDIDRNMFFEFKEICCSK